MLAGLGLEALLLAHGHYPAFRPLVFSALAVVAGVVGGKAWYVVVHRGRKFDGWCIQGDDTLATLAEPSEELETAQSQRIARLQRFRRHDFLRARSAGTTTLP